MQVTVNEGETIAEADIQVPEKEGFTFNGWDGDVTAPITADAILTAQWEEPNTIISFRLNSTTAIKNGTETIKVDNENQNGYAFTYNKSTYVPVRFMENMGADIICLSHIRNTNCLWGKRVKPLLFVC